MFGLGLNLGSAINKIVTAIVNLFTPSWSNEFTLLPQDSDGFSIYTPAPETLIYYVDDVNGDDLTGAPHAYDDFADPFLPTSVNAYKTYEYAYSQMRGDGFPDWLLAKRGTSYTLAGHINVTNGLSDSKRKLYGAYGDVSLPRPILKTAQNLTGFRIYYGRKFFDIASIELDPYTRRIDSPDYLGWGDIGIPAGISIFDSGGERCHSFSVEDMDVHHYTIAVSTADGNHISKDDATRRNIVVRRNILRDSYAAGRCQGLFMSFGSFLIQQNILNKNGWLVKAFTHDPALDVLTVALTGAAETEAVVSDIDANVPDTNSEVAVTLDDASVIYIPYSTADKVNNKYIFKNPVDFTATTAIASIGNKAVMPWTQATAENHSSYCSSNRMAWFDENMSFNPSSMHWKSTANPKLTAAQTSTLAVSLTGVETLITLSGIESIDGIANADNLVITKDSNATVVIPYSAFDGVDTFTVDANFTGDIASAGNSAVLETLYNYESQWQVALTNNYTFGGELDASIGGNDSNNNGYRYRETYYQGNVCEGLGRFEPTNRALAWYVGLQDTRIGEVSHNYNIHTSNANVTNKQSVSLDGYGLDVTVRFNHSYQAGAPVVIPSDPDQINTVVYSNPHNLPASAYIDPTRSIETYAASLGLAPTADAFIAECLKQRKGYWRPEYTAEAINSYLKAGFALVNAVTIVTDLADDTYTAGQNYTVTIEAVSDYDITYEWYVDGVLDATNTSAAFVSASVWTTSKTLKCVMTANGQSFNSSTVSITEAALVNVLNGTDAWMELTSLVSFTGNFLIEFDTTINALVNQALISRNSDATNEILFFSSKEARFKIAAGWDDQGHVGDDWTPNTKLRVSLQRVGTLVELTIGGVLIGAKTSSATFEFNRVGTGFYGFVSGWIANLSFVGDGVPQTTFTLDSGALDGQTEESVEGGSFITMHNPNWV